MGVYLYKDGKKTIISDTPPPDGRPCTAVKSNQTYGMAVCMSAEEWQARLNAVKQGKFDRDMAIARKRAEAQCEQELREKHNAIRKKAAERLEKARKDWYAATDEVNKARKVVADHIARLDELRFWHDKIHDGVGLALDLAGVFLPFCPALAIALAIAGAANALGKGWNDLGTMEGAGAMGDAGSGGLADVAGYVAEKPLAEAMEWQRLAIADGTITQAQALSEGQMAKLLGVRGVPILNSFVIGKDLLDLVGNVDKFPFSSPQSVEMVKKIKDYFASYKLDWNQAWNGPSREEVNKSLDDLLKKMEKEQAAQKEYAAAIISKATAGLGAEMATCIDKRETQLGPY